MGFELSNVIENTEIAIEKGISYLHEHQYPNGEYCCYMGPDDGLVEWCIPDSTVFPTSLIAYCLKNFMGNHKVDKMLELSRNFLQYQAMIGGVWNHYTKWHILFPICPPDIDNAFCALKVLELLDQSLVAYKGVLYANQNEEKLFYTWYAFRFRIVKNKTFWLLVARALRHPIMSFLFWTKNECKRDDIDAVVNANGLFYLGYQTQTQSIIPFLINIIEKNKEDDCDKWYRNPFTVYYFISRNYELGIKELEPIKNPIIERILHTKKKDGSFGKGVLDTALGLSALADLGYRGKEVALAIQFLLDNQAESGSWLRWALFYSGKKKELCWGSEEVTTAFCLEALGKFKMKFENKEFTSN